MLPGPTIIRKCSKCNEKMGETTFLSGNTCGAECWTDSFMLAPMLPQKNWLVKCPHCDSLLWLDELENLGELNFEDDCDTYLNLASFKTPDQEDLLEFLRNPIEDLDKELFLRQRLWWAFNDKRRYLEEESYLSSEEIENLKRLTQLLNESDESQRLLVAEIYREMKQFEKCLELLEFDYSEDYVRSADFLRNLASEQNSRVMIKT